MSIAGTKGLTGREREVVEMAELLEAADYDPKHALRLNREGMGPEELAGRLRHPGRGVGGLGHSHNIHPMPKRRTVKFRVGDRVRARHGRGEGVISSMSADGGATIDWDDGRQDYVKRPGVYHIKVSKRSSR
jgi:hypothetical protein